MEVVIDHGEVLIKGVRRWPALRRPSRVFQAELPHGLFARRLPLPPGTYRLVGQEHVDGCLQLTLQRHL